MRQDLALVVALVAAIFYSDLAWAKGGGRGRASVSSARPYYGGGKHTTSHGGHYIGGLGSSHRGGHYFNLGTGNQYGIHK
jgi:hypothetical protein